MSNIPQFLLYGIIEFSVLAIVVLCTHRGARARRHDLRVVLAIATIISWWSVFAGLQRGSEYASALTANYVFAWGNLMLFVAYAALCGGRRVLAHF